MFGKKNNVSLNFPEYGCGKRMAKGVCASGQEFQIEKKEEEVEHHSVQGEEDTLTRQIRRDGWLNPAK